MRGRETLSSRWKAALLALGLVAALALPSAGLADAEVVMVKPFTFVGPNPCTGDAVEITGQNHTVLHIRTDSSGGIHAVAITLNAHGSGFDLTSPFAKYSIADRQFTELNISELPPELTAEVTADFRTRVVRAAELPSPDDFFLRTRLHMTFNGNGQLTASFLSGPTAECR